MGKKRGEGERVCVGGSAHRPHPHPWPPRMRISLPRHDLLGEKKVANLSKETSQEPFAQWAFIGFILHRKTDKAHQSLSGSKDQTIDNIQQTLRAYAELGSVS